MAGKKKRGFITYRSYLFKEKDPIIDVVRTSFSDSGKSYKKVADESGVTPTTLSNWFHGKTRKPQFCTVSAVLGALGKSGIRYKNGKPYLID